MRIFIGGIGDFSAGLHLEHGSFLYRGGIGEITVGATCYAGLIDILMSRAGGCVVERAVIGTPAQILFSRIGVGNLHCSRILHRSHEHIATAEKCHRFSIGRHHPALRTHSETLHFIHIVIGCNIHGQFHRGCIVGSHCVDFPIVGESHGSVGRTRKEPNWMGAEIGQLACRRWIVDRKHPQVETVAVAFAEDIHIPPLRVGNRITVLTRTVGQIGMLPCFEIIHPHIARHR